MKVVLDLWIYVWHSVVNLHFDMYDSSNNNKKILLVLTFPNVVCFFWTFNATRNINFVKILILLKNTKIVEIWTKFFICRELLKAQKTDQTTFWKCQDYGYFEIFNYKILLLNLDYFKNQRRPSSPLASVLLCGIPCR